MWESASRVAAVLPHEPGHVVVGPHVADGLHDVSWPVTPVGRCADRSLERRRGLPVGGCGSTQRVTRLLVHAGKCRMFKSYGHDLILRDNFVVCYHELST